ncbi:flagellar basal body L-ring protein FlgH [Nostoc ellipsosporum NOK]|uniref:flagellar basal body L-ring protein FlgH n=1 Tax=Sphingomonas sp. IBVSS2 TaxID=1985172 RepID=UPI000A2E25B6|nr:flagellar basal body L-ring protein FlgH [Sphingomonas sp. IBVSS2]MDF2387274.1 flagellar basal body L-ring protein FlgH [Nostoc ellipsosporum NOK]OSZ64898.1 flagellar basal body L-ring protein [Sphingomonas sp. IBVSS2]
MRKIILAAAICATLSGCGAVGRLKQVGKAPKLSEIQPVEAPEIEPSLAMPSERVRGATTNGTVAARQQPQQGNSASLFRTGAGALFRDQRANKIGDILTIKINIADKADLGNNTSRTRGGSESGGLGGLLGISPVKKLLGADANAALETNSGSKYAGGGTTARSETINMTMAAIVTQVLPNGNLMIKGRQEVRVNFEMRELIITGLIRPEDIARDNSIRHSQIAEARVIYGGKGQLTDAQQARWGQQIYDALFPF